MRKTPSGLVVPFQCPQNIVLFSHNIKNNTVFPLKIVLTQRQHVILRKMTFFFDAIFF